MQWWIVATLAAAGLQVWRTALQQRLRGALSPNGAGFVRYAFGAPWSLAAVGIIAASGHAVPRLTVRFALIIAVGGIAQIVGTNLLIRSFGLRDFAIGTAYSKTEALQTAGLTAVVLHEVLPVGGWIGVLVSLVGVAVLATRGDVAALRSVLSARGDKAMWAGIGAGGSFAITTVCIKSASNGLGDFPPLVRALTTLAVMNSIQMVVNATWLASRQRGEFAAIRKRLRSCVLVGLLSVAGSAGWAIGVTLQDPARVRSLGQVDLVLAFVVSRYVFHEPRRRSEYLGSALVVSGVLLVLLS